MGATVGQVLDGCRLDEVLGHGGMGTVYRGVQLALERPVAVKVISAALHDDPRFRERFARESLAAAAVEHPNILPVYDAGEADGELFLVMRLVDGHDAAAELRRGPLEAVRVGRIVENVGAALDAAHTAGLVHRDVKPANILLPSDGVSVFLSDFGLARRRGSHSDASASGWVGTLHYLSPEQIRGDEVDGRTDVYALACTAFELLTGRRPFTRDSDVAVLWAHMSDPSPSVCSLNPELPAAVDAVFARGMAKDRETRYPSAGEFAAALGAALKSHPPAPPPVVGPSDSSLRQEQRRVSSSSSRPSIVALCGLAYAAGVMLQVFLPIPQSASLADNPSMAQLLRYFTVERPLVLLQASTTLLTATLLLAFSWLFSIRFSRRLSQTLRLLASTAFASESLAVVAGAAPTFGLASRGRSDAVGWLWNVGGLLHATSVGILGLFVLGLFVALVPRRPLWPALTVVGVLGGLIFEYLNEDRFFTEGRPGTVLLAFWVAGLSTSMIVGQQGESDVE